MEEVLLQGLLGNFTVRPRFWSCLLAVGPIRKKKVDFLKRDYTGLIGAILRGYYNVILGYVGFFGKAFEGLVEGRGSGNVN